MVFQLHFALGIDIITPKLANLVLVKVRGIRQNRTPKNLKNGYSILANSANFDQNQICEFWGYDIDSKCKMKLKHHTFRISKVWDS